MAASVKNSAVQKKIENIKLKVDTLKKSAKKLEKENEDLLAKTKQIKRAKTILGLQNEMQEQDMVIEVIRGLLPDQEAFDRSLGGALDEGPKRIRPPAREELYMQINQIKREYKKLEEEFLKLVPSRDPEKFRTKSCQTESVWLEDSALASELSFTEVQARHGDSEQKTREKVQTLAKKLATQKDMIEKVRALIESKGSKGQKIINLKEDYEDLKQDLQSKEAQIEKYEKENAETRQRVQKAAEVKRSSTDALHKRLKALQDKIAQVQEQNSAMLEETHKFSRAISEKVKDGTTSQLAQKMAEKKQELRRQENELSVKKTQQQLGEQQIEDLTFQTQKVTGTLSALNKEFGKALEPIEEEERFQKLQENDIDWEVQQLKARVRQERLKEVMMEEEVESLESRLQALKEKTGTFSLTNMHLTHGAEREADLVGQFRLDYEARLNQIILLNTELKKKATEQEDFLALVNLKDSLKPSEASINSDLESIQTFAVMQPSDQEQILREMREEMSVDGGPHLADPARANMRKHK